MLLLTLVTFRSVRITFLVLSIYHDIDCLYISSIPRDCILQMATESCIPLLRQLSALISSSIDSIEKRCTEGGLHFPGLDECTMESEATKHVPQITQAISTIVAAATQICATVQPAQTSIVAACLQVCYPLSDHVLGTILSSVRALGSTVRGGNVERS